MTTTGTTAGTTGAGTNGAGTTGAGTNGAGTNGDPPARCLSMARAMVEAVAQEMDRDPSVFVLGEDVGAHGGIFGSTAGLLERFGPQRVMDTPISETAFVGVAVGAAVEGMRPIAALTVADTVGVCMDQVYNHMAKIHYESGGRVRVPMVLAAAVGGGHSGAAQHSQCLWGTFAHLPGMKVVVPSTPRDAKGLMTAAVRDDNPVMYLFHKAIMGVPWMAEDLRSVGFVPEEPYEIPIGSANVVRPGRDVTVVALARSVHHALDVADALADGGPDCEVIDLRSVVPLDTGTILRSVGRTGRLVVVDEDYRSFGLSGEIVARVVEHDPRSLRAAPRRVCVPDTPIPYARALENAVLPTPARIREAVLGAVGG